MLISANHHFYYFTASLIINHFSYFALFVNFWEVFLGIIYAIFIKQFFTILTNFTIFYAFIPVQLKLIIYFICFSSQA